MSTSKSRILCGKEFIILVMFCAKLMVFPWYLCYPLNTFMTFMSGLTLAMSISYTYVNQPTLVGFLLGSMLFNIENYGIPPYLEYLMHVGFSVDVWRCMLG